MKTEDILQDDIIVCSQGEKYQLKFHAAGAGNAAGEKAPTSDRRLFHSPIIKFSTMLVRCRLIFQVLPDQKPFNDYFRPVATDKRAFYLLNTTERG